MNGDGSRGDLGWMKENAQRKKKKQKRKEMRRRGRTKRDNEDDKRYVGRCIICPSRTKDNNPTKVQWGGVLCVVCVFALQSVCVPLCLCCVVWREGGRDRHRSKIGRWPKFLTATTPGLREERYFTLQVCARQSSPKEAAISLSPPVPSRFTVWAVFTWCIRNRQIKSN